MIVPLEIWDFVIDGASLFERRADEDFFDALADALVTLRERGRIAFVDIALVGGGVDIARARSACAARRLDVAFASADPFFAAEGASGQGDVVVDVGQTSMKIISRRGRARRPRACDDDLGSFAASIASAIDDASPDPVERVLLALPCAVADNGVLGESSYPTAGAAGRLEHEVRRRSRIARDARITIMNDAVLAARVVDAIAPSRRPRLVLTIGHGVGAALLATGER